VRDAVTFAWTSSKTLEGLQAEVTAILADLDSGRPFQDVAAERSQFATISQPITRDGDGTAVLNAQVANEIFAGGPGSHGSAIDGDGEHLIYHVIDITPAEGEPDKTITDALSTAARDTLYADFIGGIRDEVGIRINQQALSTVLALDQTQQ
jgi:peptidyl-prolyl cis-trans isomerase D